MARYIPFQQQAHEFIDHTSHQVLVPDRSVRTTTTFMQGIERCRAFAKNAGYRRRLQNLRTHQELRHLRQSIGSWHFADTSSTPQLLALQQRVTDLEAPLHVAGQPILPVKLNHRAHRIPSDLSSSIIFTFFFNLFGAVAPPADVETSRGPLLRPSSTSLAAATKTLLDQPFAPAEFESVLQKATKSR